MPILVAAVGDETGKAAQVLGSMVKRLQLCQRFLHQLFGIAAGGVQPHQFHIGRLVGFGIFAGGFAQRRGVGAAVEYVVHHLESQAQTGGVAVELFQRGIIQVGAA